MPAKGKLLVATEEVVGSSFARTVILLLHHDESGSLGLVIGSEEVAGGARHPVIGHASGN